jgi:CheY-like chemotaxis protein
MTAPVVLVAEDEALVRMLAHETLSEAGFHVLEAAHGQEALAILEARSDVAVLFSDVDMPQLDDGRFTAIFGEWSGWPLSHPPLMPSVGTGLFET